MIMTINCRKQDTKPKEEDKPLIEAYAAEERVIRIRDTYTLSFIDTEFK